MRSTTSMYVLRRTPTDNPLTHHFERRSARFSLRADSPPTSSLTRDAPAYRTSASNGVTGTSKIKPPVAFFSHIYFIPQVQRQGLRFRNAPHDQHWVHGHRRHRLGQARRRMRRHQQHLLAQIRLPLWSFVRFDQL
jgi:hypothetical protein